MRRASTLLFALILFIAFALRLWNLGTQSLWHDEAWSVFSAYHPLAWGVQGTDPNSPPIFYIALGLWQNLAGDGVWAMRYLSLLIGLLLVAVVGLVARRGFGAWAGALAAFLTAISPILWVYSQEIRAYIAVPLLALVLLALVDQCLGQSVSRRAWLWLLLIELITLYTHNLAVPVVAWLNVVVGVAFVFRRDVRSLARWLVAQIVLAILYLPWLLTQRPTGTPLNTPPALDPLTAWNIWESYFTGIRTLLDADPLLSGLIGMFGLISLIALLAALVTKPRRQTWLIVSQALLVPIFELAIILAAHIDFHPRYFIVGVAATLILIAVGLNALARQRLIRLGLMFGIACLAAAVTFRMTWLTFSSAVYQHDDFRAIAERYAALGPDDAIIIPYGWEPTLDYYSRKLNFKARFITIPLHADAATILGRLRAELVSVRRAEFLTWYQLPADVRGAYPCVLGATGSPADTLTVQGLKTEAYDSFAVRPFAEFYIQPDSVDFGPLELIRIRLDGLRAIWGRDSLCVVSRWQMKQQTGQDWRALFYLSTILLDPFRLGQTDDLLLNDAQLPTSLWKAGDTVDQFSLIHLPEGLPAGETDSYPLTVKVYNPQVPFGLSATHCEYHASTVCTDYPDGKFSRLGDAFRQPDPPQTLAPGDGDKQLAEGVILHRVTLPPADQVKQAQCNVVMVELWRTTRLDDWLNAQFGWQIDGKQVWASDRRVPSQQKALILDQLCVPADAVGKAQFIVGAAYSQNGKAPEIDQFVTVEDRQVIPVPRVYTEPARPLTARTEAILSNGDVLVGATVPPSLIPGQSPTITLLWNAHGRWASDAVVFVHVLDSNNQVIAQNDSQPLNGARPTTSWVAGEYLTDPHTLTWNRIDYHGPATLEVGLYDAATGERVKWSDGSDHFVLPGTIPIQ